MDAWIRRACKVSAVLCVAGCTSSPLPCKPQLSVDDRAEALAHFSVGMLLETETNSAGALEHFRQALSLDPDEKTLYAPAVASALRSDEQELALKLCRELRRKHPDELAPMLLHAQVCLLTNLPEEAEAILRKTRSEFPQNPKARLALARFLIAKDELKEAISILERTIDRHPNQPEAIHLLGTLYIDGARKLDDEEPIQKSVEKGIALLEKALTLTPESPRRWQQLGFAYLAIQDLPNGKRSFERAYELAPDDVLVSRQLLDVYIEQGLIEPALRICENLIRQTRSAPELWTHYLIENLPDEHLKDLTAYLQTYIDEHSGAPVLYSIQLASLYLNQNRKDKAETVIRKAETIYPDEPRLTATRGTLLLRKNEYEQAARMFQQAQDDAPQAAWTNTPLFAVSYATAVLKSRTPEAAASILAHAFDNEPTLLAAFVQQLFTKDSDCSTEEMILFLEQFIKIRPQAAEPHYYLTILQADQQHYDAAMQSGKQFKVLAKQGGATNLLSGFFYYQYAVIHERSKQLEEAETLFRKAIELGSPKTVASARNYIAYMWAERGEKLDAGLRLIRQALDAEPDNAAFIDTLGWIYYMQGRYKEALTQLQKAAGLIDDDPAIWEHIGDTHLKLGDRCAALKHWKKALKLTPEDPRLKERIKKHSVTPDGCPE